MNLPRFAVQRPVFTTMITLIVVVIGIAALLRLRIDLLPVVEVPTLTVTTNYTGADPVVVERQVTQIVEEIIATVPGVNEITSTSSEGRSRIRISFNWGTDIDVASSDVRARLEEELSELPDDVERPQLRKFDVASFPVVILGIASDTLDPLELNDVAERHLRNRFARLEGVAQVDLWGGYERELRIALDPHRLQALALGPEDVVQSIRNANVDLPAGSVLDGRFEVVLRAPSEIANLDEFKSLPIATRDGATVRLQHIANVHTTAARENYIIRVDGQRGIRVAIRKEASANTVEVARRILDEIEQCNHDWPQIHMTPVSNQGNFIERSLANVANSVLYGGALAVLVLVFFLRSLRSTIVIALAIPLSILATMGLIYGAGLTLNLMTLGGLALGVGMMVDSSIVVLENIYRRHHEKEETGPIASVQGASEVAAAIVASTITTLVIFLPLVFVEGVTGILFGELALVVVFALIASLLVSLSLVPMLASRMLGANRPPGDSSSRVATLTFGRILALAASSLQHLENSYRDALNWALNHRLTVISLSTLLLIGSCLLWPFIGREFMPPSDEGSVRVGAKFEAGTQLPIADQYTQILEEMVYASVPEMKSAVTSVNASGRRGNATASGDIRIDLGPASERSRSNAEVASDIRKAVEGQVAGAQISVRAPMGQFLLNRLLNSDDGLSLYIRGFEFETLEYLAKQAKAVIADIPGITDIDDKIVLGVPQHHLRIDRSKAADVGLSVWKLQKL